MRHGWIFLFAVVLCLLNACAELPEGATSADYQSLGSEDWDGSWPGSDPNWCHGPGRRLHLGDFDADGQLDLLCHRSGSPGRLRIDYANGAGTFFGTDYDSDDHRPSRGWDMCSGAGDTLLVGNFVGPDSRDDLICHRADGQRRVDSIHGASHLFGGTNRVLSNRWCRGGSDQLLVGDFDADGLDDLLCHSAGTRVIDFADNGLAATDAAMDFDSDDHGSAARNWCTNSGEVVLVGDFDGNGKDDLLCYNPGSGRRRVDLANSAGTFFGTNWNSEGSSYPGTPVLCGREPTFLTGDFDGDGADDFLCFDARTGTAKISLSDGAGRLRQVDWTETRASFCTAEGDRLHAGDFNVDRNAGGGALAHQRTDLLCHNSNSGGRATRTSNDDGTFDGVCSYPKVVEGTGSSGYEVPVGNGALGPVPLHFVVLVDPERYAPTGPSPNSTMYRRVPRADRDYTHPLNSSTVRGGGLFQAEVDILNRAFQDQWNVCYRSDCLEFVKAGQVFFDEARAAAQASCPSFLELMNPTSDVWTAEGGGDNSCAHAFGGGCNEPDQCAFGTDTHDCSFSDRLAGLVNSCNDPRLVHPRALNLYVYDKATWNGGAIIWGTHTGHGRRNLNGGDPRPYAFVDFERFFFDPGVGLSLDDYRTSQGQATEHEVGHALGLRHVEVAANGWCPPTPTNLMTGPTWTRNGGLQSCAYVGNYDESKDAAGNDTLTLQDFHNQYRMATLHGWIWQQHFNCSY
jgi:hypothetical protein